MDQTLDQDRDARDERGAQEQPASAPLADPYADRLMRDVTYE